MSQENGQIAIYQTDDGQTQIDVRVEKDTLWLTLLQIAELFNRDKSVISRHLKNIFDTGELPREATVAKIATVQTEGDRQVSREIEYFNLDAVISVGYRVNSIKGTQFRIWATQRLREYLVQGLHPESATSRSATRETVRAQTSDCLVRPLDPQQKPIALRIARHSVDSGEIQPRADRAGRLRPPAIASGGDAHVGAAAYHLR